MIAYLERLVQQREHGNSTARAALAVLRRGLGRPPGETADVFPHVVPFLRVDAHPDEYDAYELVATLFALHQITWHRESHEPWRLTNLGASFAMLRQSRGSESIEGRFTALLNCHRDSLPSHLRHAVSLLKSSDIRIDWEQLLRDVLRWQGEDRRVQKEWARAYWSSVPGETTNSSESETTVEAPSPGDVL